MLRELYFITSKYPERWTKDVRVRKKFSEERCLRLVSLLDVGPGELVLEIGTGEGRFIPIITSRGAFYTGVDISYDMLRYARERLDNRSMCELVVAEAKHLPFRDKAFDKSFCYATIFFIPNQRAVVREMRRVSKSLLAVELRNVINPAVARGLIYNKIAFMLSRLLKFRRTRKLVLRILKVVLGEGFVYWFLSRYLSEEGDVIPYYPAFPAQVFFMFKKPRIFFFDRHHKLRRGLRWLIEPDIIVLEVLERR